MANNKIKLSDGTVLIDLTNDTVDASKLKLGETAHDKTGAIINGSLEFVDVYSGQGEPSSSLGSDGDLYLVIS